MKYTSDKLYGLLPAILRQRDEERGGPLRALCEVFAREGRVVEDDLQRFYENLFIETCEEWAVPYLGDLLGVRGISPNGLPGFSQRARVAHTLAYRRRKGTAPMLEQLALDTTGWRARAVECFELLPTTRWLNHPQRSLRGTPDLRQGSVLDVVGTAFETTAHSVDVRRIASSRGKYNISNLGLHLWRLAITELEAVTARLAPGSSTGDAQGRWLCHPAGLEVPLFNPAQSETEITSLANEREVPGALRRRALHEELDALRQALVDGRPSTEVWFDEQPVFSVQYRLSANAPFVTVPPSEILIADLSDPPVPPASVWLRPPAELSYFRASDQVEFKRALKVAWDPVTGRLAFPTGVVPIEVRSRFTQAFPGDVGGGDYDRSAALTGFLSEPALWQAVVGRDLTADASKRIFTRFEEAITAWNSAPAGTRGVIALIDNGSYFHGDVTLEIKRGSQLLIVAADWPERLAEGGGTERVPGDLSAQQRRAHLVGKIEVRSAAPAANQTASSGLSLNGLLIEGELTALQSGGAGLSALSLSDCTLLPGKSPLRIEVGHDVLAVSLERVICGSLTVAATCRSLTLRRCGVLAEGASALLAATTPVTCDESTVLGTLEAQELQASNCLFQDPITVHRTQEGCVRFCYVPDGSSTPRRHRCQPDLALAAVAGDAALEAATADRVTPSFTSTRYGAPGLLQLQRSVAEELATGADNSAEMGLWNHLFQAQREANLRSALTEFLPLPLEAGLFYVT